jgi:double-strand break repair protein MRE11
MREVVLQEDRQMRKIGLEGGDNKAAVDRFCMKHVDELIKQANAEWLELQQENEDEPDEELVPPLPLVRLRVEYTAPEGGSYIIDNPQRFSARYADRVANTNDIIQYHRKKTAGIKKSKAAIEVPDADSMAQLNMDAIKIDELVKEFLTAQNLTILPQSAFGDAVQQFVQKDDKHAMEEFIMTTMGDQVDHLVNNDGDMEDENAIAEMMEELKNKWEQKFEKGDRMARKRINRKPKPDGWDSDFDGHWEDDPDSVIRDEQDQDAMDVDDDDDDAESVAPSRTTAGRGRGTRARGRGGSTAAAGTTRKAAAASKKPVTKTTAKGRGKKKDTTLSDEEEEEEANEVINLDDDDDDDDDEGGLFMTQESDPPKRAPVKRTTAASASSKTTATRKAAQSRQTQLSFNSQTPAASSRTSRAAGARATASTRRLQEPDDDEISDDDAFETPPATTTRRR